ncbi:MAG: DUF6044 family protein [Candidatus Thorarchaeota archaeon]|nr:DUF6044 family protein [Candidatus Thorarchaeota archaeon]
MTLFTGNIIDCIRKHYTIIISLIIVISHVAPYYILGPTSQIGVHDTFDSNLIWYKVLAESGMVFAPSDAIVPGFMDGLPRLSFGSEFYFLFWLIAGFGILWGYIINITLMHIVGFVGMYFLLKTHFLKEKKYHIICLGVAICYAILPFYPPSGLSASGIPLALYAFLNIRQNQASWKDWLLIIVIPFYSSLVYSFFFFITAIGILWLIDVIRDRKLHQKFLAAIALMAGVFLVIEYRLVSSMLFETWFVSHRTGYVIAGSDFIEALKIALNNFIYGHYHSPSFQTPIIMLTIGIGFLFLLLRYRPKLNLNIENQSETIRQVLFLLIACIIISIWYGVMSLELLTPIKQNLSIFRTFQFDRFYWLQSTIWYLLFALSLTVIYQIFDKTKLMKIRVSQIAIVLIILLQIGLVYPTSWATTSEQVGGHDSITFEQFYAEKQFMMIRDDIGLPQESYNVISIGLHPAIATYNGFYTLDGYSWNYPLEYKMRFRNIIAFELEKNETLRLYFDEWGNRCYTFVDGLNAVSMYTKDKNVTLDNLQLNITAMHELQCSYVISAVNISNYVSNSLQLLNVYNHPESAWMIFLYEVI